MRRSLSLFVLIGGVLFTTAGCGWDGRMWWADDAGSVHRVSAERDGRDAAVLHVVSSATTLVVRTGDLGDDLVRIATPDNSEVAPQLVMADDTVALHLTGTGDGGPKAVDIELSDDVRWELRFSGGYTDVDADLAGVSVASVEFTAGITRIDLALPEPTDQVPVRVSGGASQFTLHTAEGVPVRVRVGGGAGTVSVDGAQRNGIPGGTDLTPPGWAEAERRIDVQLTSGVSTVVVDRDVPVQDRSVGG
jgi:hypothetical protein